MPTPSNTHSTNTHPCGWPNPTSFHWLHPLFSPCLHTPNGKPHLLMPHTSPVGWQRDRHGELDSELQIMDLRLRELGREPAPAPAKHRMSMADLIVPAYSALFQTPICIVNTAESSRTVERELLPLQIKGNGHINAGPCWRERAEDYCPGAPECSGLGVMSHNWQRDDCPLRAHSLLSLAWLWRVFLCVCSHELLCRYK